ncbi:hypothetical protein QFC21_007024 [Naganishia friedmannii]|uniref:Uncharacterized protein n=2 Tax=Naganishia friedmannii TaxID=89922 RepID=A0ACC2UYL9_9TREE|nr:hypothetical protein QFC21_007240 [Naganishia friedmannii]KAJ9092044.1 hypothetical protein QFC21_007024 [Naganishia friedmannii]
MPKAKPSGNTKSATKKKKAPPVTEEAMPKKKSVERVKKNTRKGKDKEAAQVPRPRPRKKTADAVTSPTALDPEIRGAHHPAPRADTPLAVTVNDTTTPAKASHKTHHVTSEMSSGSAQQVAMEVVMEENRRLKEQLGGRTYVSVERPSERKRNNPYDIAPLRKILGLHPLPEDPDYLKELKNEAYNFLRETARDIVGDQQLARTLDRGAHWDNLLEDKQKELRDQAARKGGAFGLTFFTKPSTGSEHKFTMDWPANELIKTVLRDQRVGMENSKSKLLYGNAVFNEVQRQFDGRCSFPSEPIVRQVKGPKKHTLGRPRKDPLLQASLSMTPESKSGLKELEKTIREKYRAFSGTPEFSFEPTGNIIMPTPKPAAKKKQKMGIQHGPTHPHNTGTSLNTFLVPIPDSDIASAKTTSAHTHPVASVDMSINDIEKAYGGFISKGAEEMMDDDAEKGLGGDFEGQNLSLPDHDEEDDEDQDQEHDSDDDKQDLTASGSDLSSSESSGFEQG